MPEPVTSMPALSAVVDETDTVGEAFVVAEVRLTSVPP